MVSRIRSGQNGKPAGRGGRKRRPMGSWAPIIDCHLCGDWLRTLLSGVEIRVVSRAGLFGSGSGLRLTKFWASFGPETCFLS